MVSKAPTMMQRWLKPEVYPLIAAMTAGLSFLGYSSARAIGGAPDVLLYKESRLDGMSAGIDEKRGKEYKYASPVKLFIKKFYAVDSESSPFEQPQGKHSIDTHRV